MKNDYVIAVGFVWRPDNKAYILLLHRIFRPCLATGYVPAIWRQVKVVFILKPGRNTHNGPRNYRPISLTSFLLQTVKRLVDKYLRGETLAIVPLHPNQNADQDGKSVETALHQLVVRVEKVLHQQYIALGAFLDIEGLLKIPVMTPCVMLLSGMVVSTSTPSCDGSRPPWRAVWLSPALMKFL